MSKYKLVLDKIGIFKNTNFDLDEVTVFYGPNEVGKTTVIDGVINAMAEGRKNQHITREILEPRYGDNISTKLKLNSNNEEIDKIDHDLVRDLLLVRASKLSLSVEGKWIDSVKNKLFTGGVNPRTIIDAIELMENKKTKGSQSPLYEVISKNGIDIAINKEQVNLDEVKSKINNFSQDIKDQCKLKNDEENIRNELNSVTQEYLQEQSKLNTQKTIAEREMIISLQAKLSNRKELDKDINELSIYTDETYNKIVKLEKSFSNKNSDLNASNETLQGNEDKLKINQDDMYEKRELSKKAKIYNDLAVTTLSRLEIQISESEKQDNEKPTMLFVLGGFILLIGIGVFVTLDGDWKFSSILPAIIGIGIFLKAFMVQGKTNDSELDLKVEVRMFNQEYNENPPCPDEDYASVTNFIRKLINTYQTAKGKLENAEKYLNVLNETIASDKHRRDDHKKELDNIKDELCNILPKGTADAKSYYEYLQKKNSFVEKLNELEKLLNEAVASLGVNTREDLVIHVEHKIIEINNNPIEETLLTKNKMDFLEKNVNNLQSKKNNLTQDLSEVSNDLTQKNIEIKLDLGSLYKEQLDSEKNLSNLREQKKEKLLEMDSLLLLKSIVEQIDDDTSQKFQVLSESINEYMQIIFGKERAITFDNLTDIEKVKCHDYYGSEVDVDQLSSGTQDAFYLSARLAFLEKVELQDDAFLILDDPFIFMDEERKEKAIEAIKKYYDKQKHPLLLFTKDEDIKNKFCYIFKNSKEIVLNK